MAIGFLFDFGNEMTAADDDKRGKDLLEFFVDEANRRYNKNLTYSGLLARYGSVGPLLAENVGLNQRLQNLSRDQVREAFIKLIDIGQGNAPQNWLAFGEVISKKAMQGSWWEALKFTAWETAKDVSVAKEGVMNVLKSSQYMLPILIWGGAGFLVYVVARSIGSSTERFGKAVSGSVSELSRAGAESIRETGRAYADKIRRKNPKKRSRS
jgi:hypothetical protein